KAIEDESNFLLFDQPAGLLDGLRRAVAVIEADEIELAAVDPSHLVDHLEIGGLCLADHAVGRQGPTIGHSLADFDLSIGDAKRVGSARSPSPRGEISGSGSARLQEYATR